MTDEVNFATGAVPGEVAALMEHNRELRQQLTDLRAAYTSLRLHSEGQRTLIANLRVAFDQAQASIRKLVEPS